MKILHVIDSGGMYGAEKMVLALAREQQLLGMEPAILSIGTPESPPKALEGEARARGVPVHCWRMRKGLNLVGAYRIVGFAQAHGFDVLHSHGYKGNILLGLLPRGMRRLPLVGTLHGWTALPGLSRMAINQWLECRVLPRLDAVIVVNASMLQDSRLAGGRLAGAQIIDNGIEWRESSETVIDSWIEAFCSNAFVVGAVGRLSPEKGFTTLIDALAPLCHRYDEIKAVILGEGPERPLLEQRIAAAGLRDRIVLPGYIRDAAAYMRYFDVVAISSRTEGLPITLLEAMSARVPVVATRVGGVPAVLEDGNCGALVEPDDAAALADALERVYRAPEQAAAKALYAEQRVREKYSSRAMAEAYLGVYRKVIERGNRGL